MKRTFRAATGISINWQLKLEYLMHTRILLLMSTSKVCGCFKTKTCYSAIFTLPIVTKDDLFLFSFPLPVISCYLLFNYVVATSLCTWQLFPLRFISPSQHQSCYFRAMMGKHRHDGAWTSWLQAAKRLLTAYIAHNNYTYNKPRSTCCRIQSRVSGRDGCYNWNETIIAHFFIC